MMNDALISDLVAKGARVASGAPVAELTTYRIGGPVAALVRAGDEEELDMVASVVRKHRPRIVVLGRGSNLLVADGGFDGLAVVLDRAFERLHVDEASARAGGAVPLPVLARRSAAEGRAGLEFYVGIPGTVGGAVRMNAGGHGRETADVLCRARVFDLGRGDAREVDVRDLELGYRRSALASEMIVTEATFVVGTDDPAVCEARIAEIVRWRREHQPGGSNAGSVFRNPPGDSAGRLIDAAGLRGLRIGGAVVSEKHANFFRADRGATATDVAALVAEVRRRVAEHFGIDLEPELHMVGFEDARGHE